MQLRGVHAQRALDRQGKDWGKSCGRTGQTAVENKGQRLEDQPQEDRGREVRVHRVDLAHVEGAHDSGAEYRNWVILRVVEGGQTVVLPQEQEPAEDRIAIEERKRRFDYPVDPGSEVSCFSKRSFNLAC
jgi:hypothetical protein